ncbi:hypothetical protein ACFFQW_04425 [Umezawaea endophytica]|uniref:Uncharacterized protein n=1 Tax=Umezawaea endophytica TaxID=1654476 RepID=A0A9X3AEW1_9PSEU|nr:hypothetical protein [Umezawaea endophytica]MCS7476385.1 hypothetical protein [Umezawaea endophytica]
MQDNDSDEIDVSAGVTKRVVDLRRKKAESSQLRGLVDDPDMLAVRIEGQRRTITRGMWFFLTLGLGFTTAGVQDFLAGHRPITDPLWWAAWLAEPMLAGILIMLLVFESEVLSHGLAVDDVWVRRLKRTLLTSTLFMNVWPALAPIWGTGKAFEFGNLAIHLIVPLVVFMVAEVMPVIQQRMNEAILKAYRAAKTTPPRPELAPATPPPALVTATRLKLPESLTSAIKAKAAEVASEGRTLTVDDVRATVRVSADMAEQIVREVHTNNGHAFTR